ncbi:MAG: hypothetical protein ACE5R6_08110 [Candidatus Heimdallarchaeota archaeon]
MKLNCKWDKNLLTGFLIISFSYIFVVFFGMAVMGLLTRVWWPLIVMIAFFPIFFIFIEIRVLCSHCPFYAEDSKILHCLGNHGIPKLWRYRPGSLNQFEKISVLAGFLFFFLVPFLIQAYGIWFLIKRYEVFDLITLLGLLGIAGATLLSSITIISTVFIHHCSKCVNFSCPLNKVPKSLVDEYLERNPIMKKAWIQSGYKLG